MAAGSTGDAGSGKPPLSLSGSSALAEGSSSSSGAAAGPFPSLPSVSLPKGGGAIRGIGEKFDAHPTTGTASMHVPVATSPGRSGFSPQLSLAYDSGTGNGPFGIGWSLWLPCITRKTDKGLPQYRDDMESDVFLLSGAEDLVPELTVQNGCCSGENLAVRTIAGVEYRVKRYRPRIEGPFSRFERWTSLSDPAGVSWRSISRENVTTWYGKTAESRIADPGNPQRIFSWLVCESSDDKGNVMVYEYKREDGAGVAKEHINESHRTRTANLYPKRIRYGNRAPYLPVLDAPSSAPPGGDNWFFDVVCDYGEHDPANPSPDHEASLWPVRNDPFSSYRSGFEIRTYRLCQRILMFHHFPDESEVGSNCLVHSTDLAYSYEADPADARNPIFSALLAVTHTGYQRSGKQGYLSSSLPPVEFAYSEARIQNQVRDLDLDSLVNLPQGLDGTRYQWADLDGEGLSGVLTEQAGGWFYKRNQSPLSLVVDGHDGTVRCEAKFGPVEMVPDKPGLVFQGPVQLLDLEGDGRPDAVRFDGPAPGYFSRTDEGQWEPFATFRSLPNVDWGDPNLKLVDLDGDGLADVLITEAEALAWHPSLGRDGFGPAQRVSKSWDEERGPAVVFADSEQSIYLADMSGDGLSDLVRIRNGHVCYWPNLGYGRFGAKVAMDNAPWFDRPEQFSQQRIRLADIDGSGTTDILYLHAGGVHAYFNQSGNAWSPPTILDMFPVDSATGVQVLDLMGNGTACIVWSSPLAGDARQPMRYLDLMGGQKPHLLVRSLNNLGAETRVQYAPSTKFYLADELMGQPWITKLPFPVHVVERVETYDQISRTRFVTRYAYHHGYFDGFEREFHGFGMVERWDTEEADGLGATASFSEATNLGEASHVPPVLVRTWFHTGAFLKGQQMLRQFAHEYYREDGLTDAQVAAQSLEDTMLPADILLTDGTRSPHVLRTDEMREACRALKGSMLRQETYGLDRSEAAARPYAVSEYNYTVELLQAQAGANRHAVFVVNPREMLDFQYERAAVTDAAGQQRADPRMSHSVTLLVDAFGNALRTLDISYPRRDLGLNEPRAAQQTATHITLTANRFANRPDELDWYRVSLPVETRTYEMVKPVAPLVTSARTVIPFRFGQLRALIESLFPFHRDEPTPAKMWPYEYWDWRSNSNHAPSETRLRLIEHGRVLYRRDDLSGALPPGQIESLALPYESYKLAFTRGLLAGVLQRTRRGDARPPESLLPDPAAVLGNRGSDQGGYVELDGNGWWLPSGRLAYAPAADFDNPAATAGEELAEARAHFFLLRKHCDPFGHTSAVSYRYDLEVAQMQDAVGNTTSAMHDYRVLQPSLVTDANGNRTAVAFDALGMVTATAIMGPVEQASGDRLDGMDVDISLGSLQLFVRDPRGRAASLLGKATTRIVYDLDRFRRTGQPPFAAALAREIHVGMLQPGQAGKIQMNFTYSDGFGRAIQAKKLAEEGLAPERQGPVALPGGDVSPGSLELDANGRPVQSRTASRWVGDGRTVYNNKGKPVRQYEPFFSSTHLYEDETETTETGVSSVLFYDPVERVVGILHPNHTWEKVVYNPWRHAIWDVNDTLLVSDPKDDAHVGDFFRRLPNSTDYTPTWHAQRRDGALGSREQDAARKAAIHANTPTMVHADSLGRTFLTVAHNRFKYADASPSDEPTEEFYREQTVLDIEGNLRKAIDANGRTAMQYDYDMLGNRIHQASMEAGERWILSDAAGKPIRTWDSRHHMFRAEYDELRRPVRSFVTGADDADPAREVLAERLVYGEQHPHPEDNALLNMRGKLFLHFDQAGVVAHEAYDFKGNGLASSRRLAKQYKGVVSWSAVDAVLPRTNSTAARMNEPGLEAILARVLEPGKHTNRRTYDALSRPLTLCMPDNSIVRSGYNEAGLLDQVHVDLQGAAQPRDGQPVWTPFVTNIEYDAKGQRQLVDYGIGVRTTYAYDPLTFRLVHALTRRNADAFADDCPQPPRADWPGCQVQNLRYTYDPVGNITHIRDDAQQILYFRNKRVEPSADYTYDATYRLIEATGREHLGQAGAAPTPSSYNDSPRVGVPFSASDGNCMARYLERYVYDMVGNFQKVIHRGSDGAASGWTRSYVYDEPSQLEPDRKSNRLSSTATGTATENYRYGGRAGLHGNMTAMPHLSLVRWNHHDQLEATSTQTTTTSNGNAPETTWYVYDAGGQRVRKVTERQATVTAGGTATRVKAERVYLSGGLFEIYRKYSGDGETATLERTTLHVADDKRRVALVETRTRGEEAGLPARRARYQFCNHLGSSSLELDDGAQIISYEEYTPFGSTSYQMVQSHTKTPRKRYRYTGKERDKETGFYYHGARYYAPWLGRWTSPDPAGLVDGANLYAYVQNSPLTMSDPTGLWGWREVAVLAAVVVVGTVVSVATAGAAAPLAAAAAASVGLSGTAAAVATGVAVGAVAGAVGGAAGGAAGEATRQVVHGEQLDVGRIASEARSGAESGALIGGAIGAAVPLAAAAAGTTVGAAVVGTAGRIGQQVAKSGIARALVAGGKAVAQLPGIRHAIQGVRAAAQAASRGLQAIEGVGESASKRLLAAQGARAPAPGAGAAAEEAATPSPAATTGAPSTPAAAEPPAPISGDPPYDPWAMKEMLETRYGAANVESTTVPAANAKNVRLRGTRTKGIVLDRRGYPIFDDVAVADLRLSGHQARSLSRGAHQAAATRELRDILQANPALRSRFTPHQLRAIQAGKGKIPGFTWHHHQDVGRMQLVPSKYHKVGHVGGFAMWGKK